MRPCLHLVPLITRGLRSPPLLLLTLNRPALEIESLLPKIFPLTPSINNMFDGIPSCAPLQTSRERLGNSSFPSGGRSPLFLFFLSLLLHSLNFQTKKELINGVHLPLGAERSPLSKRFRMNPEVPPPYYKKEL